MKKRGWETTNLGSASKEIILFLTDKAVPCPLTKRPTDPQLCLLYLNLGLSGPSSLFSKTTISLDALKSKIAYTYDCATIQLPKRQLPWGPLTP